MRFIILCLFLIVWTVLGFPVQVVIFFVHLKNKEKGTRMAQKFVCNCGFRSVIFLSGVKVTVKGKENIPKDTAALYVYNHRSFYDIIIGYVTAPCPSAYVAKKEISKVPMIYQWMWLMNCLFLDREDAKQGMKTIAQGAEMLKNGTSVYIAPEGTRNKGEETELLEFHRASFMMAEKSKCPIVPVAIVNTASVWEQHMPWVHRAHVIFEYCEPIEVSELDRKQKKELAETVRDILSEKVRENRAEI